ncbi:hypothetical protein IVB46_42345 [Bradyrhizobium sp. 61]|uniref:hypothetical protein n=1 Tax=unclassified Bradyrhizobium TaxID=2631580 RepID=UPI001FF8CFAD|nr:MULTISPECIES: hypothetical protein [unclassified Bradyrhizobium]MCK1281873.1 hypothetical protein [Bradyrhizobium sp. 61]MCK1459769.1 hypothetical protein [Bradyrhizobium sp. 2]
MNGDGSLRSLSAKIRETIGVGSILEKASGIALGRLREKIVDWELINSVIASERKDME